MSKKNPRQDPNNPREYAWTFTLNNYTEDDIAQLQALDCKYMVFGKEIAPETGTPHLQGYVYFKSERYFNGVRKLFKWHVEPAKGSPSSNLCYAGKDSNPYIKGDRPSDSAGATDWSSFRQNAKRGLFDDIPDHMYCRYVANAKRIFLEDREPPEDLQGGPELRVGLWIYGPPGTGKSHHARTFQPFYEKPLTKWWCGYRHEPYVIMDDFAPEHAAQLTGYLKRWTDKYKFNCEVKNGAMTARPKRVIITSNYTMDECFKGRDLDALKRRFEVLEMFTVYEG